MLKPGTKWSRVEMPAGNYIPVTSVRLLAPAVPPQSLFESSGTGTQEYREHLREGSKRSLVCSHVIESKNMCLKRFRLSWLTVEIFRISDDLHTWYWYLAWHGLFAYLQLSCRWQGSGFMQYSMNLRLVTEHWCFTFISTKHTWPQPLLHFSDTERRPLCTISKTKPNNPYLSSHQEERKSLSLIQSSDCYLLQ